MMFWLWPGCAKEFQRCASADECTQVPPGATAVCLFRHIPESPGFCTWACDTDADCEYADLPPRVCTEFSRFDHFDGKTCVQPCAGAEDCGRGWGCGSIGDTASPMLACYP